MAKSESESCSSSDSDSFSSSSQSQSSDGKSHDEKNVVEKKSIKKHRSDKKLNYKKKKMARSKKKESSSSSSSSNSSSSSSSSDGEISTTDSSCSDSEEEKKTQKTDYLKSGSTKQVEQEGSNIFHESSPKNTMEAEKSNNSEKNSREVCQDGSRQCLNEKRSKEAALDVKEKLQATLLDENHEQEDGEISAEGDAENEIVAKHFTKSDEQTSRQMQSNSRSHGELQERIKQPLSSKCERSSRMSDEDFKSRSRSRSFSKEKQRSEKHAEHKGLISTDNSATLQKSHSKLESRSNSYDNEHGRSKSSSNTGEQSPRRCSKGKELTKRSKSRSVARSCSRSENRYSERRRERERSHSVETSAKHLGKSRLRLNSCDNAHERTTTSSSKKDKWSPRRHSKEKRSKSRCVTRSRSRSISKVSQCSERRESERSHFAENSAKHHKSHSKSGSRSNSQYKERTKENKVERSPRRRSKEKKLRKRSKSRSILRSRSRSISKTKQRSVRRERGRSHSVEISSKFEKSHSKSESRSNSPRQLRSRSHDNFQEGIKPCLSREGERSSRLCSDGQKPKKGFRSRSGTRSPSRSSYEEKRHERKGSHSAENSAKESVNKKDERSPRRRSKEKKIKKRYKSRSATRSRSKSLSKARQRESGHTHSAEILAERVKSRPKSGSRSKSPDNLQVRSKTSPNNRSERSPRRRSKESQTRKRLKSRSVTRSRSRSLCKEKQRSEIRSERFRSQSADNDRRVSRRSASLERRREERKKRHAERDEEERAKRAKKDEENVERREKELSKPDGDPDKVKELDNTTVTNPKAKITERQRKTVDLLTSRTGGAYIPPAKLRLMQAEITDKSSAAYQRIAWEALKKSIHGYINKVNVDNIAIITRELLKENIVRGRGLLCRSIIQAQAASPTFTHVYAALVSIINSKFPNIGLLLLNRLVIQFKRAFRRNDKAVCLSSSRFIAHLVNQRVAHEILALEVLTLLVESPTDDSVEVAIAFLKECGMKLTEVSSKGIGAIFEMLKNILHEGKLDKRVQYMIEVVFQVRKDGFKDHQSVIESLELVEEDDQITHLLMLDDATNTEDMLNAFRFDEEYAVNEEMYKGLSKEILGSDASDSNGLSSESGSGSESDSSDSDNNEKSEGKPTNEEIIDNTETNLIALRRTIYLTINSSLDYEECAHKLMKMQLKPGQEIELCHMFLDCCAEQRTYEKFYGLLAQRFCSINKIYIEPFEEIFKDTYQTTHRLDTNRLRNVSKFFAHLLFTDAISWDVLECIKLNEDDTTSSSRIFIKILFQELAEYMGLTQLNKKLKDEVLVESLAGLFPKDNPRNTRFSINFFTSIGLGGLTDELRQFLKNAPKSVPAINAEILANKPIKEETSSSSSSSSTSSSSSNSSSESSSTSSDSNSDSEIDKKKRKRKKSKKAKKSSSSKRKGKKKSKKKKTKTKKTNKKRKKSKKHETTSSESDDKSVAETSSSEESSESSSNSSDEGKRKSKKNVKQKAKQNKKSKKKSKHTDNSDSEEEAELTNRKIKDQKENGFKIKKNELEFENRQNRRGNGDYKNERFKRDQPQRRDSEVERRREERERRHRAKEQRKDNTRSRSRSQTRHYDSRDYRDRYNRGKERERESDRYRERRRHEERKSRSRSREQNKYEKRDRQSEHSKVRNTSKERG